MDNGVVIDRGRKDEGGWGGYRGMNGAGQRPDLGGEHMTQCTDGVL